MGASAQVDDRRLGTLTAFRAVFGEDPTPESITAAVDDPVRTAEALLGVRDACLPTPSDLPSLSKGELRPLVLQRGEVACRKRFTWAEHELDRITGTLLYAHRVVVSDPISDFEPTLRDGELGREQLLATLHLISYLAPLVETGVVLLVQRPPARPERVPRGPWPTLSFPTGAANKAMRWFEERTGWFDKWPLEDRPSRTIDAMGIGLIYAAELIAQTNALQGKAHLLVDDIPYWNSLDHSEGLYYERGAIDDAVRRATRRPLLSRMVATGEGRKVMRLVQRPLPDFSFVTPQDLLSIRDAAAFPLWRTTVADALERYEAGVVAGRWDVGEGLAAEFRGVAERLEAEVAASGVMAALRRGASAFGIVGSAAAALSPFDGFASIGERLALPAVVGVAEFARALVQVSRKAEDRYAMTAHASAARGVAERFSML
jgi:hypothetical protein